MSDATKTVTVTCWFGVEIPAELDLDKSADYDTAMDVVAQDLHHGEMLEAIDDIRED